MSLQERILDAKKRYKRDTGVNPRFVIVAACDVLDLSDQDDPFLDDVVKFKGMIVAVTYNKKFKGFVLR